MMQLLPLIFHKNGIYQRGIMIFVSLLFLCTQSMPMSHINSQVRKRQQPVADKKRVLIEENDLIDQAIDSICEERNRDPQGSIPIDEMALQPALSINHPSVKAGKKRAQRLLPKAKKLVPSALSRIAASYNLELLNIDLIVARVKAVNTINVEVEAYDNALWRSSEPRAIIFGTIFLAGIRSDEAMITVLAHELIHAVDGTDQILHSLFMRVGARASRVMRMSIRSSAVAELVCEMVGIRVMQDQAATASSKGAVRRLARALGKNCVIDDLGDETHLSPRKTLRVLLALEPEFLGIIATAREDKRPREIR